MHVSRTQKALALDKLIAQHPETIERLLNDVGEDSREFKIYPKIGDIFPIERLPAELRVEIYKYLLLAEGPIKVSSHVDEEATHELQEDQAAKFLRHEIASDAKIPNVYTIHAKVKVDGARSRQKRYNYGDGSRTSILYVSKSVYAEARPILYGHNKFTFENPATFTRFMGMIGGATTDMTDISIMDLGPRRELPDLARATRLRSFKIVLNSSWGSLQPARAGGNLYRAVFDNLARGGGCSCPADKLCRCVSREERQHLWAMVVLDVGSVSGVAVGNLVSDGEKLAALKAAVMKEWDAETSD